MFCKTELFLFCSSSSLQMGARPFFSPQLPTGAVPCTAGRLHQGSWKTLLPSALILHINLWLPGSGNQADCWFALGEVQLHECEHSSRVCIPERPAQRWKDGTKGLFAVQRANAMGHQQTNSPLYSLHLKLSGTSWSFTFCSSKVQKW